MSQTINLSNTTPAPPANAINIQFQNDNASPPNVSGNIPSGLGGAANVVAKLTLTAQAAAITATTLYAIPAGAAGMYRVSFVATITTAGTSSTLGGAAGFQLKYTNIADSVVKTTAAPVINSAANTTGTSISGDFFAYCNASTNLQFLFGYTSSGTAMNYDITIYVEYVGP